MTVRAGSFVAAGVGPSTPFGLLARVVSARHLGGSTVVTVRPASLLEAVPAGSLSPADDGRAATVPARAHARRAAPARRARGFRAPLVCGSGAAAAADGSLAVRLIPTFKLDWSLDGIDRAEAVATIRGDANLRASVAAAGSCSLDETSVARWYAPPLRFFAGPIPVVVVPRVDLFVAAEAEVTAAAEVGVRGRITATAGLSYDGDVHAIGSFSHHFAHSDPAQRVTGTLGARLVPAVTFLIYGRAGPRFDLSTGLELNADSSADPWWTLTAPVALRAGLEVPGVDELTIPQRTVFSRTFPIASAPREGDAGGAPATGTGTGSGSGSGPGGGSGSGSGTGSGSGAVPGAGSGSGSGSGSPPGSGTERARITWNTGATDVDLHVWDAAGHHAWFRDPTGIPGAELAEDDRYGFGPEHFREHSPTGRAFTYGLCYFDDSGAGPTTVSIHLTDPGGGARDMTRTLAREGDHVLIGSSPPGSAPPPPDGWCRP